MDNETMNESEHKSKLTDDLPTRKPRGFKIALIVLAALLVLFVCTIVFLPHFLPIGTIRSIAQSQARDMAGVDLDFKNFRFGWNGDLVLDDITVAALKPDGTPGETLLTVNEVRTNVALTPLLSGKAVVNSVDVNGFAVNLVRDADGNLNLPDFNKLAEKAAARSAAPAVASAASKGTDGRMMLSTARAAEAGGIPPIELRRVNLQNGLVTFTDVGQDMKLDLGVDNVRIEGGSSLDDPFNLSGKLYPYPDNHGLGAVDFVGTVAMLKGGALNPDGHATIEAKINNLSLAELAEKVHLGELLSSGIVHGSLKAAYADRKGGLVVPDMRVDKVVLGLGDGVVLSVPDTVTTFDATFDPAADAIDIAAASVKNDMLDLTAGGRVAAVSAATQGGLPGAELDFGGSVDFSRVSHYLSSQNLGPSELPELEGKGAFSGKAALPATAAGQAPAPTLTLALNDGDLQVLESATGIVAGVKLQGIEIAANTTLTAQPAVHSRVGLTGVPVRAFIPDLGNEPVTATVTGGVAFEYTPQTLAAELRADKTTATIPATPWSQAANIHNAAAHITADLKNDVITIHSLEAVVNDSLQGRVVSGTVNGALAGAPQGAADVQVSALLEHVRQLVQPLYPADIVPQLAGSFRASARVKMENNQADAYINSEIDDAHAGVVIDAAKAQAEFRSPKSTISLLASVDLANPKHITVQTFEAAGSRADIRYADSAGKNAAGQFGNSRVKFAARVDAGAMQGEISDLSVDVNGMTVGIADQGTTIATLSSGLMQIVAGAAQQPVRVPLKGAGDFALPVLDFGINKLAFQYNANGQNQESQLGDVRARLAVDGYIGPDKRQLISVRAASLAAAPLAVNSRAQMDLGTGAFLAEYAARVAPSGLSSILAFLGLPPALLTNAAATGNISYNNGQLTSKGAANGELNMGQGEIVPFETAHDLSALWNPNDRSLALEIRRLDGNMKTPSGEAVATMAAKQSQLLLSRAGSRGMVEVQFSGSAGPTRALALGLTGVLPQLSDFATTLSSTQASGIYNAWLQIREKDPTTLGFTVGGTWKGAALSINNVPYLAEAGELSAAMEGDFAYQQNTVNVSRLFLRSESAQIRADGAAAVVYTADDRHMPTGLSTVNANLRFLAEDVARAGKVFPGVLPQDLGLTGRIEGTLTAAGDAANVQVQRGEIAFQNFRATPSPSLVVTIPRGSANFGATLALHFAAPATGSPYDIFRMIDIRDGKASLTGALVRDKQVNNMAAAFTLQNGVLTIHDAQVVVGGGADGQIAAAGAVDFNSRAPAVNVRLAMRNIPLAEANSEISDFMQFQQGVLHIPAQQGQAAGVAFSGFSKDEILQTLRLENFSFNTSHITLLTGPVLNAELDKARALMKQTVKEDDSREITLNSIEGSAIANGTGVISFPEDAPINVHGDNTADFRVRGSVRADHTLDMKVMIAGNLEKLIGFTIPNIIPNLSLGQSSESQNLMARMNENAAKGKYGVHVKGPLESPDISGIGAVAVQFLKDVMMSVPTQLLGNVLDAPQSVLQLGENVVGGLTNPGETLKNAPENVVKGLGHMFGVGGSTQNQQQDQQNQQDPQQQKKPENILRGLGRALGGNR